MRTRPAEEREQLLKAVAAGAPLADLGVPLSTVRSWRRRDPEFAGRFAEAQAAAARVSSKPLAPDEWERLLAEACRRGSVAALRLWNQTHRSTAHVAATSVERVDQLAKLRALHASVEAEQP